MILIYKITNLINNKIYIGQTSNTLQKRWKNHIAQSIYRTKSPIQKAIRKYKPNNFEIKEIDRCFTTVQSNKLETKYILKFKSHCPSVGYNATYGGGFKGKPTQETLQKLRKINLGENNPQFGIKNSKITRFKKSIAMRGEKNPFYGKTHSQKTIDIIKKANLGQKHKINCNCCFCKTKHQKGKKNPFFGKHHTEQWKKRHSGKNHHFYRLYGEQHPSWRGGFPKCTECGKLLSRRDAHKCKSCFNKTLKGINHPCFGKKLSQKTKNLISIGQHRFQQKLNLKKLSRRIV